MLDNDSDTPEIEQNSETLSEFQDSLEYIYTVKTQCIWYILLKIHIAFESNQQEDLNQIQKEIIFDR